jgi:hypothetical protein
MHSARNTGGEAQATLAEPGLDFADADPVFAARLAAPLQVPSTLNRRPHRLTRLLNQQQDPPALAAATSHRQRERALIGDAGGW